MEYRVRARNWKFDLVVIKDDRESACALAQKWCATFVDDAVPTTVTIEGPDGRIYGRSEFLKTFSNSSSEWFVALA